MIKKICLLLLIASTTATFAQERYSFTLQEAVTFAIDSNYTALNC